MDSNPTVAEEDHEAVEDAMLAVFEEETGEEEDSDMSGIDILL